MADAAALRLKAVVLLVCIAATSSFVAQIAFAPRSRTLLFADELQAPSPPPPPRAEEVSRDETSGSAVSSGSRQASYGVDRDMPDSYVRCGKCQTVYAMTEEDLGGRGRRLECSVCDHSWFQSKDRLMTLTSELEMSPLPQRDLDRIKNNMEEGKPAKFMGEKKLYVGNIAFQCHEDDFFEVFGKCGDVGEVSLVRDDEGKIRGFGFVTMRTNEGGDKAIADLDGTMIRGRSIAVRESNT